MTSYRLTSRAGVDHGVYPGATPAEALAAMAADAGGDPGPLSEWVAEPEHAAATDFVAAEPGHTCEAVVTEDGQAYYCGAPALWCDLEAPADGWSPRPAFLCELHGPAPCADRPGAP